MNGNHDNSRIPADVGVDGLEAKWRQVWDEHGTYRFDRSKERQDVYSIDTPPPTVSGALHPGHVFSYTHTDFLARFQRMRGKEVFYPMGWDDNGLNVERRVQLMTGTIVDPTLPYDPDFLPPAKVAPGTLPLRVSRPNFIELCQARIPELEASYHDLWSTLGLSVDWTHTYTTIGAVATAASQRAFLRLVDRGLAYRAQSPTLWDIDFQTAVAQAELEDRELPSAYHRLLFHGPDGRLAVDTTRPELLPACVALVTHPADERHAALVGAEATVPLYGTHVPILAHELADPEKGTGLVMACTFGDTTDVTWWRELGLPVRPIIQRDGRLAPVEWGSVGWEVADPEAAQASYDELVWLTPEAARARVLELLGEGGHLEGSPQPITHHVRFWENGSRPVEIVTSDQWFIRYPDKEVLLQRGRELRWHPDFMRVRYENWVAGLMGDWNITRQRFFGVPFPVWYPIDKEGVVDPLSPILADESMLPVDPTTDVSPGYEAHQRNRPGGFAADPDVMDTWATSSLTPQIACGWERDDDLFRRTYPMDLRPQAHEIIRTWLFSTVVRSHYEHDALPWTDAAISGFIIDPDRKKLSKSAGNMPSDPTTLIETHGADAVRYWAAQGRLGMDLAFDERQMKTGRRFAVKLLNVARFALQFVAADGGVVNEPLDRSMLATLADLVDEATTAFEAHDYARAIERTEAWFWSFCDDYVELVKTRAYTGGEPATSAGAALGLALDTLVRLLAPFLPFATEEVWSCWRDGSVHRTAWPSSEPIRAVAAGAGPQGLVAAVAVLHEIRKAKSAAQLPLSSPVESVEVSADADWLLALQPVVTDLAAAGRVGRLELVPAANLTVEVALAPSPS